MAQRTMGYRGFTIREVAPYKWTVDGWDGHSGYVTADAAIRSIMRMQRDAAAELAALSVVVA